MCLPETTASFQEVVLPWSGWYFRKAPAVEAHFLLSPLAFKIPIIRPHFHSINTSGELASGTAKT